jgi:hypothetical protein
MFVASAFFTTAPTQQIKSDGEPPTVLDKLWIVTAVDSAGQEGIAQATTSTGQIVPLIAADQDRLEEIREAGRLLAAAHHMKLHLVLFSQRSDVAEFTPTVSP